MLKLIETNPNSIFTTGKTPRMQQQEYVQGLRFADVIEDMYLDYVNNYLTVEKFAADNDLSIDFAYTLLDIARAGKHRINY